MTLHLAPHCDDFLESFTVPDELAATCPPESRGMTRDQVRLMVSSGVGIRHLRFGELASVLKPGDLVVVNNSATIPASLVVDKHQVLHFSTVQTGGFVVVEPRVLSGASSTRRHDSTAGSISLPTGGSIDLLAPFPVGSVSRRLWLASVDLDRPLLSYLADHGRPIRYAHIDDAYPLDAYQTVFASVPGSAEMPSAGRPFSGRVLASLVRSGIAVASLTLHTGVSSLESGEAPYPERFQIPETTASLVNVTKARGSRIIAVGTTVVRALESVVDANGVAHGANSMTDLVIGPEYRMKLVDGLITGWHEAESTHLDMLEAVAGRSVLESSYVAALDNGYMWHEFGDSLLLLPS
jgi:S-adenosylmethionine:tRNA ribosyltransferase-isomerase